MLPRIWNCWKNQKCLRKHKKCLKNKKTDRLLVCIDGREGITTIWVVVGYKYPQQAHSWHTSIHWLIHNTRARAFTPTFKATPRKAIKSPSATIEWLVSWIIKVPCEKLSRECVVALCALKLRVLTPIETIKASKSLQCCGVHCGRIRSLDHLRKEKRARVWSLDSLEKRVRIASHSNA
jgi:hypothetical protein